MKRFIILISLSIIACQKQKNTTTGNPLVSLSMSASQSTVAIAMTSFGQFLERLFFSRATASPPPAITDAAGNSVSLDQGWMVVKEIEFEATEVPGVDEVDGNEIQFAGPYVVNLFSAVPDSLGSNPVSATAIRRIKMKLHRLEIATDSSPSDLLGKSLFFHGTIDGIQFSFVSEEGTEFQVGGPNALSVHENMNLLLSFRIAPIISQIDLSAIKLQSAPVTISESNRIDGSGQICTSIDPSATTIYDCFRKALEQQANLGDDSDGSGEIESDESGVN